MNYQYVSLHSLSENKPLVFIDFDYTISDFGEMKKAIKKKILGLKLSEDNWGQTYNESKTSDGIYHADLQIQKIANILNLDIEKISKIFNDIFAKSDKYVYDDVFPFLKNYSEKVNFILLTLGDEKFQFVKRVNSKIDEFLTGAIYTKEDKALSLIEFFKNKSISQKLYFIDDRMLNLYHLFQKLKPLYPDKELKYIWLRRVNGKYSEEFIPGFSQYDEVRNLSQVTL